ncbi:hypothetical protein NX059_009023 [Plenodomus lindquistii]|nr:hypothetical protein NX059_009023 [Plenodomus lindquistii]
MLFLASFISLHTYTVNCILFERELLRTAQQILRALGVVFQVALAHLDKTIPAYLHTTQAYPVQSTNSAETEPSWATATPKSCVYTLLFRLAVQQLAMNAT